MALFFELLKRSFNGAIVELSIEWAVQIANLKPDVVVFLFE